MPPKACLPPDPQGQHPRFHHPRPQRYWDTCNTLTFSCPHFSSVCTMERPLPFPFLVNSIIFPDLAPPLYLSPCKTLNLSWAHFWCSRMRFRIVYFNCPFTCWTWGTGQIYCCSSRPQPCVTHHKYLIIICWMTAFVIGTWLFIFVVFLSISTSISFDLYGTNKQS